MDINSYLIILSVLLFLLIIYILFSKNQINYLFKKQNPNTTATLDLITIAMQQKSDFIIGAMHTGQEDRNIIGYCYKKDSNSLFIDIEDSVRPIGFLDEDVKVYFSVLYKGRPVYYQFTSHVSDILSVDNHYALLISIPDRLDSGQKRSFIRVTPQKESVLAISIWITPEEHIAPSSLDTISQANFNFRPDYEEDIGLENVSAGGMLLVADMETDNFQNRCFNINEQILIFIVLRSDQNQKPISFWLIGNVILTKKNPLIKNQLIINIAFVKWAIMETDNSISWFSTGTNGGVPPLANWVLRHYLEQNKLT